MSASIHLSVVQVSGESSCLRVIGRRFWKAGEGHIQKRPGWTEGPTDLTYEAWPWVGGFHPPIGPSPGTPSLCSCLPTGDT